MKTGIGLTGIDHPAISVPDVDKWPFGAAKCWGTKILPPPKPVWRLLAPGNTLLEIMPIDDTLRPAPTTLTPGWSHLALRVVDIDQAIAYLDGHNVTWTSDLTDAIGGGRVRAFADPEGNMLHSGAGG
jgi:glyoxylase I family protein